MLIPLEFNKFGVDFINTTCISDSVYSASLENISVDTINMINLI